MSKNDDQGGLRAITLAAALTVETTLPTALLGAVFPVAGRELDFGTAELGIIISAYWVTCAALSLFGRRVVGGLRSYAGMTLALSLAFVSLAGSALLSPSWSWLAVWAGVGGLANALAHPTSNTLLTAAVPINRRALAFGLKQAAVPAALLIAGLSLPALIGTLGWRWAYAPAVLIAALVVILILVGRRREMRPPAPVSHGAGHGAVERGQLGQLLLISGATFFGAAHSNSMTAFAVNGAVDRGIEPRLAGVLLLVSSVLSIVARIASGYFADKGVGGTFKTVALLLVVGAMGMVVMTSSDEHWYALGCLLAFTGAFGWAGLVHYVVADRFPDRITDATMITQSGSYVGSSVGPAAFGLAFATLGLSVPWLLMAAAALVAACLALVAERAKS